MFNNRHLDMPNPFLTPPQNKKGRPNDKRQMQERGSSQENPFLSTKSSASSSAFPKRNCFSNLANPLTSDSNSHSPPPLPTPPPSFDELFPSLTTKAAPAPAAAAAPLNFKLVVQANLQPQHQQQPPHQPTHQPTHQPPHQPPHQRRANPFLSNANVDATNIRCKNNYNVRTQYVDDDDDDDDYYENSGSAYDSAYANYYKD